MNNCKVRWPWPHCSEQTSDLLGQSHSSELFTARLRHSLSVGFNSFLLVCRTDNPFGSGFSAACQNSSRLCVQLSQCPSGRTDVTVNELSATLVAAFWVYLPSPLTHPLSDLSGCAASVLLAGRRQLQTAGGLRAVLAQPVWVPPPGCVCVGSVGLAVWGIREGPAHPQGRESSRGGLPRHLRADSTWKGGSFVLAEVKLAAVSAVSSVCSGRSKWAVKVLLALPALSGRCR